jgi:hypothetical protein
MAHGSRKRPISGTTPAGVGATYIIVEAFEDTVNIQLTVNGTVTAFTCDWTNENILYDATALAAVNINTPEDTGRYVAPASATWNNITLTANTASLQFPVFALRLDITTGTSWQHRELTSLIPILPKWSMKRWSAVG